MKVVKLYSSAICKASQTFNGTYIYLMCSLFSEFLKTFIYGKRFIFPNLNEIKLYSLAQFEKRGGLLKIFARFSSGKIEPRCGYSKPKTLPGKGPVLK